MINNNAQTPVDNTYTHYIGVKFPLAPKSYYFGFKNIELKPGDSVVVETIRGVEMGEITGEAIEISKYNSDLGLKPILRKATDLDFKLRDANVRDAKYAIDICRNEVEKLKLEMTLLSCEYTLDKAKVIFTYVADERIDFRELLKVLASKLHTRIELRQIGARDKAKLIGGIGICGLPLCCTTFLNEFDGISINRAKNQMLAINIPKLSGQCGKLVCCLKYEDDAYTEEKKQYPDAGFKVFIDKVEYTVTGINIVSKTVKLENEDDIKVLPLEEFEKQSSFGRKFKNREDEKK